MSVTKMLALAIMLVFGASQLALLQTNPYGAAAAKGPIQGIRKRRRTIIAAPARIPAAQGRVISETAISSGHQQCEAASKRPGCSSQPGLFLLGRI
jgi:hypothetical protein